MALSRHLISTTPVMVLWLLAAVAVADSYGGEGDGGTPPPTTLPIYEKPSLPYGGNLPEPLIIAVEGVVSCKIGSKYSPLKGVVARITCMALNEKGNEMAPFSFPTFPTDDHGYFLATLSHSKLKGKAKVTQCKAFLPPSPCADCKYLTNVNNGVTGAPFRGFRILTHKKMKLYSVGPFFYSSEPSTLYPLPDGY